MKYFKEILEAHPNSKTYDKCWDGYRKVPGKKRGEKGSCEKIQVLQLQKALEIQWDAVWLIYFHGDVSRGDELPLFNVDTGGLKKSSCTFYFSKRRFEKLMNIFIEIIFINNSRTVSRIGSTPQIRVWYILMNQ